MAINYFQDLGLGSFDPAAALQAGQAYKMNQFNFDQAKKQAELQDQARQAQIIQFQNEQQKARAVQGAQAFYNALSSGNTAGALQVAKAYEQDINALGDPSFTVNSVAEMAKTPQGIEQLKQMSLGMVQMAGGPEQYAKFTQAQQAATQVKPMTAYETAQAQAKQQELGLKQQEIDVSRQRLDIERESKKLEAMQKAAAATANDLKREELQLKIDEQRQKVEEAKAQKQADFQVAQANIANTVGTLDKILKTPYDVIDNATGPINQKLLTTNQDTADFEELINTFDSQAFLAQIPQLKGTGALSEAEGKKLSAALQNMSLRQKADTILNNAKEAKAILENALRIQAEKTGNKTGGNLETFLGRGAATQSVGPTIQVGQFSLQEVNQ